MLQVVREGVVRGRVLWVVVVYVVAGCGEGVVGDRVLCVLCTVLYGEGVVMDGLLWAVVVCMGAVVGTWKTRVMCCVMWGRGGEQGVVSSCGVYGGSSSRKCVEVARLGTINTPYLVVTK